MTTKLSAALKALINLIDAGREYPDAEHIVSTAHKVSYLDLREAYDTYCAG